MQFLGVNKVRTTPYHPQSNGAIERWHRGFKAALMARLDNNKSWIDEMHTVMLGLRTAPRSDTGVSAAELTFGRTLRLPGEFFEGNDAQISNADNYVQHLQQVIRDLRPRPLSHKNSRTVFVHPDLKGCQKVFVRNDFVRKSLQPPYDGPYRVIKRLDKGFVVQFPNRQSLISIDRLKPAYVLNSESTGTDPGWSCSAANASKNAANSSIVKEPTLQRASRYGQVIKKPVRFNVG